MECRSPIGRSLPPPPSLHRYITDRRLPDKAIDLVDEAASLIRVEIDSKPEALDRLERRLIQLKIEREALAKEEDEASRARLARLESEIAEGERDFSDQEEVWKAEKASVQSTMHLKERLEAARQELDTARRAGDLARMAELQHGYIPGLERDIATADKGDIEERKLLRSRVQEDEIASIVSRWTRDPDGSDARRRTREAAAHRAGVAPARDRAR